MKTGVYKITNQANDKMYVGSAIDLMNRWYKHKSQLNKNKHHSIKLQRAWNKYGVDNFKFEIIEECDKEKLIEIEQYYIDLYDSIAMDTILTQPQETCLVLNILKSLK